MNDVGEMLVTGVMLVGALAGAYKFFEARDKPQEAAAEKLSQEYLRYKSENPLPPDQTELVAVTAELVSLHKAQLEEIEQREALLKFQLETAGMAAAGQRHWPPPHKPTNARVYDVEPEIIPPETSPAGDAIDDLYGD